MTMFEGLNDINWEKFGDYHIAIGMKTRDIPKCVRDMLNPDDEKSEYAIACLLGEGQHLGMLGNATPYIVPFVLEVLADSNYAKRSYLIMGLASMLQYMFQYQSFRYLRLALQIYDEIKKGYALYKPLLSDPEMVVRLHIVKIMAYMQDNALDALSALVAQLTIETDADVRHELIRGILTLNNGALLLKTEERKDSHQIMMSLCDYLKDNGTDAEQLLFSRIIRDKRDFLFYINPFVKEVLARADSVTKSD